MRPLKDGRWNWSFWMGGSFSCWWKTTFAPPQLTENDRCAGTAFAHIKKKMYPAKLLGDMDENACSGHPSVIIMKQSRRQGRRNGDEGERRERSEQEKVTNDWQTGGKLPHTQGQPRVHTEPSAGQVIKAPRAWTMNFISTSSKETWKKGQNPYFVALNFEVFDLINLQNNCLTSSNSMTMYKY